MQMDKQLSTVTPQKCYLPARYVLTFLLFWAMSLEYAQRVCLSVTIVAMINHTALDPINISSTDDDTCEMPPGYNATRPEEEGDYLWTPSVQGVVLGAYFYGYLCTQLVGGRLAEVIGGKWVIGLSILLSSLLTMVTPIAADVGVVAIVAVRFLIGFIHGVCLPAAFALFSHWAPVEERSTLITLCIVGDHVGVIITMPLTGYLCEYGFAGGWPSVYYILGVLGCVWFIFWVCLGYSRPSDHPRISLGEMDYILKDQVQMMLKQKSPVPWRKVLTSKAVWAVAFASFCSNWGFTTLLTKLPTYLQLVLHVSIQKNGWINSLVYTVSSITLFFSASLSDFLRTKKHIAPTTVRKGFEAFAMLGPAVCTVLIPVIRCDRASAVALLTASMAFLGLTGGGHLSIVADMTPHHSASVFGFVNGVSCLAGIFSPLVAGFLLDEAHGSIGQWSIVFYISSGVYLLGGVVFMRSASAEKQPWADTPIITDIVPHSNTEKMKFNCSNDIENGYGTINAQKNGYIDVES